MKYIITLLVGSLLIFHGLSAKKHKKQPETCPAKTSFYDLSAESIEGKPAKMSDYKGKYILVVNTASKCRYTYQYEELEKLYQKYKDQLVILGFPSNQFWGQEPADNQKIHSFCKINYGVTFPLFAKTDVKGKNKHPVYEWLTNKDQNGWNSKGPGWNFHKYLINTEGNLIAEFSASVKPLDKKITQYLK